MHENIAVPNNLAFPPNPANPPMIGEHLLQRNYAPEDDYNQVQSGNPQAYDKYSN